MTQLEEAMRSAGYRTPRARLERLMSNAIEMIERRMGSAINECALRSPSIAEFSRRIIEENEALLIWELFAEHRQRELSGLYERVRAQRAGQMFPAVAKPVLRPTAPQPGGPEAAPDPRAEDHVTRDSHRAPVGSAAGRDAVAAASRRSLLGSFIVNGVPLGEVTAGEARGWAKSRARDARFIRLLTEGLPDDVTINQAVDESVAEKAYALAGEADNE